MAKSASSGHMQHGSLSWLGLTVDNHFLIDNLIQDGVFSWVYRGSNLHTGRVAIFKVAKPPDLNARDETDLALTQAVWLVDDLPKAVHPDNGALLCMQAHLVGSIKDNSLIKLDRLVLDAGLPYLRFPFLEGKTLRDWCIAVDGVPVATVLDCGNSLQRLRKNPLFNYHGDLKADHVFVTASGITLIDPGFYGVLTCSEGVVDCAVTTIINYPLLVPDDALAFGFMLWDLTVGHPLIRLDLPSISELICYTDTPLKRTLNLQTYLTGLPRPAEINEKISRPVEDLLLYVFGLELTSRGIVRATETMPSLPDILLTLRALQEMGIKYLR